MNILVAINIAFAVLYSAFTLWLYKGWYRLPRISCKKPPDYTTTFFSILVPFRNEGKQLPGFLAGIKKLRYPIKQFELIFIDDESNDFSVDIIKKNLSGSSITYQILQSEGGKKQALSLGLERAKADFVITLDADIQIKTGLLECYHQSFSNSSFKLIAGPVHFRSKSIMEKMFSLEFLSLIVSGAAGIYNQKPIMLNAANLGFEKAVALEFQEKVYQSDTASGDDVFLLEAILEKYGPKAIGFMKTSEAIVFTNPPANLDLFINQRVRWASKSTKYKNHFAQAVAVFILAFNILILTNLGMLIFKGDYSGVALLFGLKLVLDFKLLLSGSRFMQDKKLMWYYIPVQLLYPFYITIIGLMSMIRPYRWKGRRIH